MKNTALNDKGVASLHLLQGTVPVLGSRTEKAFAEHFLANGADISAGVLSLMYGKTKPVDVGISLAIEKAMSLPQGWLSEDHAFYFNLTPEDVAIHREFSSLPIETRKLIHQLIQKLKRD